MSVAWSRPSNEVFSPNVGARDEVVTTFSDLLERIVQTLQIFLNDIYQFFRPNHFEVTCILTSINSDPSIVGKWTFNSSWDENANTIKTFDDVRKIQHNSRTEISN
jgi:hypothetical protein